MTTTFVLTRKPDAIFQSSEHKNQSGRFGTLIVLQGGKVTHAQITPQGGTGSKISAPTGFLDVQTLEGSGVTEVARFTTIERMGGYVQLKPQSHKGHVYKKEAYPLTYETGNKAVSELKGTNGQCFRVHGGLTAQERGILIHEAPHVGWLVGCIGPRRLNDRSTGSTGTAHTAMGDLFRIVPRPSQLFVLDW
ncbi:MAG: hypothetical protein ACLPX8_08720 [Bryobacteraceae bacterium]|jgi:hypothetical protein